MFTLRYTPRASSELAALRQRAERSLKARTSRSGGRKAKSSKDEGLYKQVHKTLTHLQSNPRHPGLRTHEYNSLPPPPGIDKVYEAYAQNRTPRAYRIFWGYGPGSQEITIIAITPHP